MARRPPRFRSWELVLASPAADQHRATLEQRGNDRALTNRCVLKRLDEGARLHVFFSVARDMLEHDVRRDVLNVDGWRGVQYNQKAFDALARSCRPPPYDLVLDWIQPHGGTRAAIVHAAAAAAASAATHTVPSPPPPAAIASPPAPPSPSVVAHSGPMDVSMGDDAVLSTSGSAPAPPPPPPRVAPSSTPLPVLGYAAVTRTPRDEFTCAGLTSKAPRHWSTLADALPALTVRPVDPAETSEERAQRLDLPCMHVDPHELRREREPSSRSSLRSAGERVTWQHGSAKLWNDAYDYIGFDTQVAEFLHTLYCIVEGCTEHLGCPFRPEERMLPGPVKNEYGQCHRARQRQVQWIRLTHWDGVCDKCGAEDGEPCREITTEPRNGATWWRRYEAEMDGTWPSWWRINNMGESETGFSTTSICIARRKLVRLKTLLARMVLNRGDTLAIRCLVLTGGGTPRPPLSFNGVVFFRNCHRCGLPYSGPCKLPISGPLEYARSFPGASSSFSSEEEAIHALEVSYKYDPKRQPLDPEWRRVLEARPHDVVLERDGFPMRYHIDSDAFTVNVLSLGFSTGDFNSHLMSYESSRVGCDMDNFLFHREQHMYDWPWGAKPWGDADKLFFQFGGSATEMYVPDKRVSDASFRAPDAYIGNTAGSLECFYIHLPHRTPDWVDSIDVCKHASLSVNRGVPLGPHGHARAGSARLLPPPSGYNDLNAWATARATANKIVLLCARAGFRSASVLPRGESSASPAHAGGSSSAAPVDSEEDALLGMPPLAGGG